MWHGMEGGTNDAGGRVRPPNRVLLKENESEAKPFVHSFISVETKGGLRHNNEGKQKRYMCSVSPAGTHMDTWLQHIVTSVIV